MNILDNRLEKKSYEKIWSASKQHFFQDWRWCLILITFFIASDAFTLYSVLEPLLQNKRIILYVITLIIASVINLDPMFLASCLRNREFTQLKKRILSSVLVILFVVMFGATFALRFSTRGMLFDEAGGASGQSSIISTDYDDIFADGVSSDVSFAGEISTVGEMDEKVGVTAGQNTVAVLLGLEPLMTSVASFYLSYELNPDEKRKRQIILQLLDLKKKEEALMTMRFELAEDRKYDLDAFDRMSYKAVQELIWKESNELKVRARSLLAIREGNPEAVELLLEQYKMPAIPDLREMPYASDKKTAKAMITGNMC